MLTSPRLFLIALVHRDLKPQNIFLLNELALAIVEGRRPPARA